MKRVYYLVGWTGETSGTDPDTLDFAESAVSLAEDLQQGAEDRGREIRYHVLRQTDGRREMIYQC